MRARGVTAAVAVLAALAVGPGAPALAGGGERLSPARDRYEPGQRVVMIGYVTATPPSWRDNGPYRVFLGRDLDPAAERLPVGTLTIQEVPRLPDGRTLRVSADFRLPRSLQPGAYGVAVQGRNPEQGLGYLQPDLVFVGVDPGGPLVRDWPLTDPAIRWLEDDALLSGQGLAPVRAADVRAGRIPPPPTIPPPATVPTTVATSVPGTVAATVAPPPGGSPVTDAGAGGPGPVPWLIGLGLGVAVLAGAGWWSTRGRARHAVRL
jgi:hypothetical protein